MTPRVAIHANFSPVFEAKCMLLRNAKGEPLPILSLGSHFDMYTTLDQLAYLRDTITAFLESEGYKQASAHPPAEIGGQDAAKPSSNGAAV